MLLLKHMGEKVVQVVPFKEGGFMKKLLTLSVIVLFLMMPPASSGKMAISDGDLDAVTATAGVSIYFNNVTIGGAATNITTLNTISIGDPSGFIGYYTPGYFGFGNFTIGGNIMSLSGTMNVDIGTSGADTRVNIALPTMVLGPVNITALMRADSTSNFSSANAGEGGWLTITNFSTQVSGSIQIFAHQ